MKQSSGTGFAPRHDCPQAVCRRAARQRGALLSGARMRALGEPLKARGTLLLERVPSSISPPRSPGPRSSPTTTPSSSARRRGTGTCAGRCPPSSIRQGINGCKAATASPPGGQETTLTSFHTNLLHLGMVVVGVPYSCQELLNMDEISGGTPYGASTMAKGDGSRQPSDNELTIARFQGRQVAQITRWLAEGAAAHE